jgi:hypothetical protein
MLGVFGLVSLCFLSRLIFLTPYLEDWDSVDLALGLRHYDLSSYQPHFPGYPVYIALGSFTSYIIPSEPSALILINIFFGSLALLPLMALTKLLFSEKVAFIAGLLYLSNPFCWLEAEKVLADPTGLFFILTALYFLARAVYGTSRFSLLFGGLFLGLSWGVRLDYFPFFVLLLYASWHNQHSHAVLGYFGFFLGIAFWFLPQLSIGGEREFWIEAKAFIAGHFSSWGGSIYSQPCIPTRIKNFFWSFYACGLGAWWPDTPKYRLLISLILGGSIVYLISCFKKHYGTKANKAGIILVGLIPYSIWVFLGQNLTNPRHVLPAIPLTIVLLAGIGQKSQSQLRGTKISLLPSICLFLLIGLWTLEAIRLNLIHHAQPPPQLQLVQFIKDYFPEHSTKIYCQETKRLFDYYAPYYQVKRVRDFVQLKHDLQGTYPEMSPVILITSLNGDELRDGQLDLLRIFYNNRYIYYPGNNWYLYRIKNDLNNQKKSPTFHLSSLEGKKLKRQGGKGKNWMKNY